MYKSSHFVIFGLSLLIILLISPLSARASTEVVDDIDVSTTWTKEGSPYILRNSISVFEGATLTINPGVVIKVEPSYSYSKNGINVFGGNIIAIGSESEPIYFTSSYDDTVGGDTDNYESCYEPTDEEGNIIGPEICEVYDTADPDVGDWSDIYVDSSVNSIFKNVFIKYAQQGMTIYKSKINAENLNISDVSEALVMYNFGYLLFSGLNISNVYDDPVSVFNHSSLVGDKFNIKNIFNDWTDVIVVFNDSHLDIKNSLFKDCPDEACITLFDGDDYANTPSSINIEDTLFDGGIGSGILTFSRNPIPTPMSIKNSIFRNFGLFAIENYSEFTTILAENNNWGSASGPYHETLNPSGQGEKLYGLVDFDPWIGKVEEDASPAQYYARITNISDGVVELYDAPSINATLVKTLPNDWVVKVISKVGEDNNPIIAGGFRWFKVEDPTDKTVHYMIAGVGNAITHLPYDIQKQAEYENVSVDNLSGITMDKINARKNVILEALDYYYDNTESKKSLYSSNDNINIPKLKLKNFPKDLIRAFIAVEIGGANFDNERVSGDYGHGMMQLTVKSYDSYLDNYDKRGLYSKVSLRKCLNFIFNENGIAVGGSDNYKKCYTPVLNSKKQPFKQIYDHYDDVATNPIYKEYANTTQSIYANIKDGLGVLSRNYGNIFKKPCLNSWVTETGLSITCDEILIIKSIWGYNGAVTTGDDYLGLASKALKNLPNYFPGYSYNNNDKMIEKLAYAGKNRIELKKHSPITIAIKDSYGNITGEVNGKIEDNIPYSDYNLETETAVVFFPNDTYAYEVIGDDTGGTYGIDINMYKDSEVPISFNSFDIPIIPGEVHTYNVDQAKLVSGKGGAVTVSIDADADGVAEKVIKTGDTLSSVAPYDFYFKKPKDGSMNKINKELSIQIKVVKEEKGKIKIPRPEFTITRVSDGYILPLNNKKLDEDDGEDDEDRKYYKKLFKGHNKNYTFKIPKNTMTEGEWKVEVSLGDKVRHSIIINMVK